MLRKYAYHKNVTRIYVQFYDENQRPLCGSDNYIRCDARKAVNTLVEEFRQKAKRQVEAHNRDPKLYCSNKWHYMQVFRGACPSRASKLTDIIPVFV